MPLDSRRLAVYRTYRSCPGSRSGYCPVKWWRFVGSVSVVPAFSYAIAVNNSWVFAGNAGCVSSRIDSALK